MILLFKPVYCTLIPVSPEPVLFRPTSMVLIFSLDNMSPHSSFFLLFQIKVSSLDICLVGLILEESSLVFNKLILDYNNIFCINMIDTVALPALYCRGGV